jgi:hypothetical protein
MEQSPHFFEPSALLLLSSALASAREATSEPGGEARLSPASPLVRRGCRSAFCPKSSCSGRRLGW